MNCEICSVYENLLKMEFGELVVKHFGSRYSAHLREAHGQTITPADMDHVLGIRDRAG